MKRRTAYQPWSILWLSAHRKASLATATTATVLLAMSAIATPGQAFAQPSHDPDMSASKADSPPRIVGSEILSPAELARQRAQEPLLELNNRIHDLTSKDYDAHFAGARLDVPNHTLAVYWAGTVPTTLSKLQAEAATGGTTMSIRSAQFSHQQLMAAADLVMPNSEVRGTVDLAVDGSGLTVAAMDLPALASGAKVPAPAQSRLLSRIAATHAQTGVPILLADAQPGTPTLTSDMHSDQSPYWAGAEMKRPIPGSDVPAKCTSGFSMYDKTSPSTRFTLTVAHCTGFADNVPINNGTDQQMGKSADNFLFYGPPSYDLAAIRLDAGKTNAPVIYRSYYATDGSIQVTSYASGGIPAEGNYCVRGMWGPVYHSNNPAVSVNCNLWSEGQRKDCFTEYNGRCVYTIYFTAYDGLNPIWCRGDSGAPIYYWTGNTVVAAGLASWANIAYPYDCGLSGGASVVATAVSLAGIGVLTP